MRSIRSVVPMSGRNPDEAHRAATPLELLFDLTFVIAFSQASSQAAHFLELGHTMTAIVGFSIGVFAVTWAWINFSWLASAYDTDDVFMRVATFVQMIGVIIMSLGLPPFFHSVDEGHHIDNGVIIVGYIIMRLAVVALWLRAARDDPQRRRTCLTYAAGIGIVQIGWIIAVAINPPAWVALALMVALAIAEMTVPAIAERRVSTPWHAHHIAERYSLLAIIALGEVITGTVLAISAVVVEHGWSGEAAIIAFAGTLLAFGLWWSYFILPSGEMLHEHRERSFLWGYLHILLFGSIAAVGAGLHVAAVVITGEAHVDSVYTVLTLAIPVALFVLVLFGLLIGLTHAFDFFHSMLALGALAILGLAVAGAAIGWPLGAAILVVALAPLVLVIGYEKSVPVP